MPILRAKAGNWGQLFSNLFPLWLNPESQKLSRNTWTDLQGHVFHGMRKKFGNEKVKFTEKEHDLVYSADPRGIRLPGNMESSLGQGMTAGAILLNVLRLADQSIEPASVENALKIVGAWAEKSGMASGRASLMHAWGRYKGLSHFFAAALYSPADFKAMMALQNLAVSKREMSLMQGDMLPITATHVQSMLADVPKFVEGHKKIATEIIPRYFAIAERFRELGEKHYAPGQKVRKKPLLDKEIMWRIPRTFKVPPVKITFKRLNKAEKAAISSMVKSKR